MGKIVKETNHREAEKEQNREPRIRQAVEAEMDTIMELYRKARQFMADHGNPRQWPPAYPPGEMVLQDIRDGHMFVCVAEGQIRAVFYYRQGQEPDYQDIRDGQWINEEPYGVVHRITSDGSVKGAGSFCLQWAFLQCKNLKIDTHRDNVVMQYLLKKNGFQYCGIIHIRNGEERLAYQKGPDGRQIPKSIER